MPDTTLPTKPCSGALCQGKERPVSDFGMNRRWLDCWCKDCRLAYSKQYDAEHPEQRRKRVRDYQTRLRAKRKRTRFEQVLGELRIAEGR